MDIGDLLRQKRSAVLARWRETIREAYAVETRKFLQEQTDDFANPVGHAITLTTEALYGALAAQTSPEAVSERLDPLVRIRAVQNFSPAQAVGFVFDLKRAIRAELKEKIEAPEMASEILRIEARIDGWALLAFDLYVKCREQIYSLRVDEIKRQTQPFLKRARHE